MYGIFGIIYAELSEMEIQFKSDRLDELCLTSEAWMIIFVKIGMSLLVFRVFFFALIILS